ncbi:MAG TPA: ABC-type transport auxiliary lipoprotein family protein [Chitinivibrionales bacterium]|nr:ABC-type transport auxiliary lipoprotein family protein [Chitinivibrionales bacterium]
MKYSHARVLWSIAVLLAVIACCGTIPVKQYYVLNYVPSVLTGRLLASPYPFTLRLKEFSIEDAYNRPQIVYRQSPFELRYYFYKIWAVKPNRMITDLVQKHLNAINLVSHIIRRFDEGFKADYELSGNIEAIEEYDSDQLWFAHLALRLTLSRMSDGRVLYSRVFDNRKRVYQYSPDNVVREMSSLLEFIVNQAVHDLDEVFAREYGASGNNAASADSSRAKEIEKFRGEGGE